MSCQGTGMGGDWQAQFPPTTLNCCVENLFKIWQGSWGSDLIFRAQDRDFCPFHHLSDPGLPYPKYGFEGRFETKEWRKPNIWGSQTENQQLLLGGCPPQSLPHPALSPSLSHLPTLGHPNMLESQQSPGESDLIPVPILQRRWYQKRTSWPNLILSGQVRVRNPI